MSLQLSLERLSSLSVSNKNIAIDKNGVTVSFSGRFKDAIFSKKVTKQNFPGRLISSFLDGHNTYEINTHGYRGPEFTEGVGILAAGCSQTFGIGVPENGTWPHLVAKSSGLSYANLSYPSASIEWIVESVYRYCDEFGSPKNIFCYFPDLFRSEEVINLAINDVTNRDISEFPNGRTDEDQKKALIMFSDLDLNLKQRARVSKRPYPIDSTTPPESPVVRSIKSIRGLERYCKAAGIHLKWSGWTDDLAQLIENYGEELDFDNYLLMESAHDWRSSFGDGLDYTSTNPEDLKDYRLLHNNTSNESINRFGCTDAMAKIGKCTCYSDCHYEFEEDFPESFQLGTDRFRNGPATGAHLGVHRHMHVADEFLESLNGA